MISYVRSLNFRAAYVVEMHAGENLVVIKQPRPLFSFYFIHNFSAMQYKSQVENE